MQNEKTIMITRFIHAIEAVQRTTVYTVDGAEEGAWVRAAATA
jgi:hypothetical protein